MILSILDTKKKSATGNEVEKNSFYGMIFGTLFCILFSSVYNRFGHGIISIYMNGMFFIPLLLGAIPYGIDLFFIKKWGKVRGAMYAYNLGVLTWTMGSMLKGIFQIAGTASSYIAIYWFAGAILIMIGIGGEIRK